MGKKRPGPRTVRPPPTLSRHTGDEESSSRRNPWSSFWVPLLIVKTGCEIRPGGPATLLPPDHNGYGLGCEHFKGTLIVVEEREHGCAHWLHQHLPEGLKRDILNGDEDELALPLQDIVELLQHPLSVLQKARRHALASPSLVASDEMPPFEPAYRHPAPLQKHIETIDPAWSARFCIPSFVCFNCSHPSIFESAFPETASQLANRRFGFSCQQDNRQKRKEKVN